ncbi:SMP-30/gluconolactonase/LRE family protein [Marinactinospora thermotolerans]|uniref:SMP-30/gluconolactonase/LRE family protein n=1 Tax=Marinactinospora thermotolerans TaxID=531310 RepID=UPI000998FA5B|nr:SMP-30/gluconolactonase/LRE family protein [Marinactinospora thermotolerans]
MSDGVEQVTDPIAEHGEGPVWFPAWGGLVWVDMFAGDVLAVEPGSGRVRRRHVAGLVAAVRPRVGGGAVVATERGFLLVDADGGRRDLGELWSDPGMRMNDGGCDPDGRFYCGTLAGGPLRGAGRLYRLDAEGRIEPVLEGVTVSNGLAWSPDGSTAYYVDSATRRVDAFDYTRRDGLRRRRPFAEFPEEGGVPDGIAVDAEGGVWVALWGGGRVCRLSPSGRVEAVVELPVSRVSACAFGGPGLRDLYVTTSRLGLAPGTEPAAGALFRLRSGVAGLPVSAYAG